MTNTRVKQHFIESKFLLQYLHQQNQHKHLERAGTTRISAAAAAAAQSSWKRMCLLASLARAWMSFSALEMS